MQTRFADLGHSPSPPCLHPWNSVLLLARLFPLVNRVDPLFTNYPEAGHFDYPRCDPSGSIPPLLPGLLKQFNLHLPSLVYSPPNARVIYLNLSQTMSSDASSPCRVP